MTTHIVTPRVQLLAYTTINREAIGELMDIQGGSTDAETLTVFAGRGCYDSYHRPNKATFHDPDYIERTVFDQGHGSILEHASATLFFTGVSRAFLTELTRHRHLSFSVRSQRFVDEGEANIVIPPALAGKEDGLAEHMDEALGFYEWLVKERMEAGVPRKQAREAARAVLPSMAETKMVVTGNLRAWHQVVERRTAPDADAEMIEVMNLAKQQLAQVSPVIFGDNQ